MKKLTTEEKIKNLTWFNLVELLQDILQNISKKISTLSERISTIESAPAPVATPDATTTVKGIVKLAGDLGGTADLPTVPELLNKQATLVSGTNIKTIEGQSLLGGGNIDLTKTDVGLSNVDNTTDINKPISTATQTALDLKATANSPITGATNTKITYDSKGLVTSGTSLIASDIPNILESQVTGLVSDLASKANIASPTFTGTVTIPNLVVNNDALINGLTIGKGVGNISSNTVIGYQAGTGTPTFSDANVFLGYQAGLTNTGGRENVFIGYQAGRNYTSSGDPIENGLNVFIGSLSGLNTTTGISNTFVGQKSGVNNTTGSYNNFIGVHAAHSFTSGDHNIVFGKSFDNGTASGITGDFNVIVGDGIGGVSGAKSRNSILGYGSGGAMTASVSNSMFGYRNGVTLSTGSNNTLLGYQSGYNITTGSNNINIGSNVTVANSNITTGSNNVVIGNDIQVASATASNQLNIGNLIFGTGLSGSGTTIAGKIGIGTNAPNAILEISEPSAQVRVTSSTSTNPASIRFSNGVSSFIGNEGSSGGSLLPGSSAYATVINTQGGASIQFGTANTIKATITSAGNMGIGLTVPTAALHVKAGTVAVAGAPLKLSTGVSSQTILEQGAINWDGTNLFIGSTSSPINEQFAFLSNQTFKGTYSTTGTATTTFTVSIGRTMANTSYVATPVATNTLSTVAFSVQNKTTTAFDIVVLTGLTGTVAYDFTITP